MFYNPFIKRCAKFQLIQKIKIQILKIRQENWSEPFTKFEFDWVKLSWFSTI